LLQVSLLFVATLFAIYGFVRAYHCIVNDVHVHVDALCTLVTFLIYGLQCISINPLAGNGIWTA